MHSLLQDGRSHSIFLVLLVLLLHRGKQQGAEAEVSKGELPLYFGGLLQDICPEQVLPDPLLFLLGLLGLVEFGPSELILALGQFPLHGLNVDFLLVSALLVLNWFIFGVKVGAGKVILAMSESQVLDELPFEGVHFVDEVGVLVVEMGFCPLVSVC